MFPFAYTATYISPLSSTKPASDHSFLTEGGVFTEDYINAYIALKQQDVDKVRMTPHPAEFELYYSL